MQLHIQAHKSQRTFSGWCVRTQVGTMQDTVNFIGDASSVHPLLKLQEVQGTNAPRSTSWEIGKALYRVAFFQCRATFKIVHKKTDIDYY